MSRKAFHPCQGCQGSSFMCENPEQENSYSAHKGEGLTPLTRQTPIATTLNEEATRWLDELKREMGL